MNAPTRHLVALVIAGNLMGCQLIKKFTDRNRDSGAAPTGTTVVTLDGGFAIPTAAYDAAAWGDAGAAANAAMAAANAAMANAADASAQAAQAMQNAQNALGDATVPSAPTMGAADPNAPAMPLAPVPAQPGVDPAAAPPPAAPPPAAPPPVAAAPGEQPAAPVAPAAAPVDDGRHHRSGGDFCRRHPGEFNQRTGQICPNVLGSHNLGR